MACALIGGGFIFAVRCGAPTVCKLAPPHDALLSTYFIHQPSSAVILVANIIMLVVAHNSNDMMMRTQEQPSSRRASSSSSSRMLLRVVLPIVASLLLVSVLINIRFTTSLMMSTTTRRDLLALSSSSAEHRRMMATRTNLHARTNQNAMPTSVERLPRRIHGENNSQSFHSRAYATLLTTAHGKSTLKYMTSSLQRDATPGARLHKRLRS